MADPQNGPHTELYRASGTMIVTRWIAVPWVLLQILAYEVPYPDGYKGLAFMFLGALVLGNLVLTALRRGPLGPQRAPAIAWMGLALDVAVLSGFVWLYSFDHGTQIWAILLIAPLEGAVLFQLTGALGAWAVIAIAYALRDVWAADRFGNPLLWNSITFRMGVGGIIALVGGLMARDLHRQRIRLTESLEEVTRIDRMRSGLVSMLGHDVRTPLTVIRGAVATLLASHDRISPEDRHRLLDSAERQALRLENLATDLLDLARLDEGRLEMNLEAVPAGPAIRDALSYVEGAEQIEVNVADGVAVQADPRRFEQVIVNLATNALRHGRAPIVITARAQDHTVVVDVTDHGEGIGDKEMARLFEPFNTERKSGSVGYGLAIVKALTEAQSGSVAYEPNPAGGTTFRVTMPASGAADS